MHHSDLVWHAREPREVDPQSSRLLPLSVEHIAFPEADIPQRVQLLKGLLPQLEGCPRSACSQHSGAG